MSVLLWVVLWLLVVGCHVYMHTHNISVVVKKNQTINVHYFPFFHNNKKHQLRLVILGETHGDRVAHFLEKRVFDDLASSTSKCGLSMEMFESDKQQVLNEYLRGLIPESSMLKDCRAWANYRRDYRPIVEAAKNQGF